MPATSYDASPDLGALYDQVPAYVARADVGFWVEEARRAGGRVLEIGCGSGRLLLPIARAGHPIVGVDSSAAMLARCRAKLLAEPAEVRERATLVEGDIRALGELLPDESARASFALAIAPFRVMQHLVATADQLRTLAGLHRLLAPGGRFVFDVYNPSFPLLTKDRSAEAEDTPPTPLADGRILRRTVRIPRVRWLDQVNEVEIIYYLRDGAREERIVQAFDMRWYLRAELEHLLARAGFRVEAMYGDFARGALTDASPEIVTVATRE